MCSWSSARQLSRSCRLCALEQFLGEPTLRSLGRRLALSARRLLFPCGRQHIHWPRSGNRTAYLSPSEPAHSVMEISQQSTGMYHNGAICIDCETAVSKCQQQLSL